MQVLLRHFGLLVAGTFLTGTLLLSTRLVAQSIVAHRLDELSPALQQLGGIYHGSRGGMYAIAHAAGADELYVHDGDAWRLSHRLGPRERILSTLSGQLLLANDTEVFTLQWRFRAPARRIVIGQLRETYDITRATYLQTEAFADPERHPEVVLETTRGILVSERGVFHLTTSKALRLVGVSPEGAFVATPGGDIFAVGHRRHIVARIPSHIKQITPIGTTPAGAILFAGDAHVYTLNVRSAGRYRLRKVVPVPSSAQLTLVGNFLIAVTPGEALRYCDSQSAPGWSKLPYSGGAQLGSYPIAIGGAATFYTVGSRAIIRTQTGLISAECVPNITTPIKLDAALTSAVGAAGNKLVVGRPDAVMLFGDEAATQVSPQRTWATFDNHMRNSVPTCVASFDGRIVVGTSDGRVLALNPDGPPESLVSVVGYGMEFSDLFVTEQTLWATFNPSSGTNSGLVKISPGLSAVQLDSTGLKTSVACVRNAPGGRLYAAGRRGKSPVSYYFEAHDLWMQLPGRIEMATNHQGFEVHELAPLSDSLIYVATSRGLLQWRAGYGYSAVPMPHDLLDADIRSVMAADKGLWFTVQGQGAYFLRDGNLHTVEGSQNWASLDFQPRGLVGLANGTVVLLNAGRVIELQSPAGDYSSVRPGIIFATHDPRQFGTRATLNRRHSLWQGDSLFVSYSLPGFVPGSLNATFTVDGATVRPARVAPGLAVFAPMQPGDLELLVRVISRDKGYSASVQTLSLRVRPYWWTSTFGILIILGTSTILAFGLVSGYTLRQRTLARDLERTVAERTRDLQIAQDRAQKASAAKSMFLATMSHEIRTPLNAVLGMSDLLLESPLSDEQRGFAGAIQGGGRALHGIVGDILDFAEIDNGTVRRRDSITNLAALCDGLIATYCDSAFDKGLLFVYELDRLPTHVSIDAQKLRSALSHLLGNAIKFTQRGQVAVEIRYVDQDRGGTPEFQFVIADTGIGIAAEDATRIFGVFEQADNSNTRRFGGTGLGLAIVRTYVECLGGGVKFDSELGVGSTFTVTVPLHLTAPHVVQEVLVGNTDRLRLAISSPSEVFERQLYRLFTSNHFEREETSSSEQSLDVLIHGFLNEPGLVAFRQNRAYQRQAERGGLIVVVHSGAHVEDVKLCSAEQAVQYPINRASIADLAEKWLSTKRSKQSASPIRQGSTGGVSESAPGNTARAEPANADVTVIEPSPPHPDATSSRPVFFDLCSENPLRILVAEDNLMNKLLILTVLTKLGYKADWVENGRLAVDRVAAQAYDLVLMDIHMPEMDGLEATQLIRKRLSERPVTICALTANASEEGRAECLASGMDDFMTKPLQVPELVSMLRSVEPLPQRMQRLALSNREASPAVATAM